MKTNLMMSGLLLMAAGGLAWGGESVEKKMTMRDPIGGKTLDHGGVGFGWGHDSMGWIRNFSAQSL